MPQSPFKITKHGLVGNLTGSVEGTASCALTASYVSGAVMSETVKGIEKMTSASYAEITPDPDKVYIITDKSASVETASYSVHADSASNAVSSSYALTASFCENAGSDLPLETGSAPYSIQSTTASVASGTASFAHGLGVIASGSYSHAEGTSTIASNDYEHAQGKFNATASSQIFSIGIGNAEASRKNAISVLDAQSASVFIQGIGDYDGTNPETGSNDVATVFKEETYITEPEMDEIFDYTRDAAVLSRDTSHDNSIYLTFGD